MDSVQMLIGVLGAACLLVASLIVVVLRRPAPGGMRQRVDEAEAQTLARIYAVQPAQPTPSTPSMAALDDLAALAYPPANDDAAPLGRMADLPSLQDTPGMLGMPAFAEQVDGRDRPLPAARMPAGPLPFERASAQAAWGDGADNSFQRPGSDELPLYAAPNGVPAFNVRLANSPAFLAGAQPGNNVGRMPGFAPALPSPLVTPSPPMPPAVPERVAGANEHRRLGALTRVYAEGIQVAYDPGSDAVDVAFDACPMRSPAEVTLAFKVLLAKVSTVLKPLGRDRAALLLDVGGLEIRAESAPAWTGSLREFLAAACEQAGTGRLLAARYNSRTPAAGNQQEMLARIQSAAPDMMQALQNTIFSSREEAAALLARLRAVATVPNA